MEEIRAPKNFIEEFIEELGTKYNIREIAFDRWGAVQMTQNLEGLGRCKPSLPRLRLPESLEHGRSHRGHSPCAGRHAKGWIRLFRRGRFL